MEVKKYNPFTVYKLRPQPKPLPEPKFKPKLKPRSKSEAKGLTLENKKENRYYLS